MSIALTERLASEIALDECGFTRSLLAPLATPLHQVWEVFDELPRRATDDWQRIATHLQMMPDALVAYARTLRESAADEHVVTRRQVLGVASHRWDIAGLEAAASAATGATAQFAAFLREELSPVARQHDGVGRDRYVVTARAFLGDDVDLDETYTFGWDELTRLIARWGRWPVSLEPPPSRRPRRRWTLIRGRGWVGRNTCWNGCRRGWRRPWRPSTGFTSTSPDRPPPGVPHLGRLHRRDVLRGPGPRLLSAGAGGLCSGRVDARVSGGGDPAPRRVSPGTTCRSLRRWPSPVCIPGRRPWRTSTAMPRDGHTTASEFATSWACCATLGSGSACSTASAGGPRGSSSTRDSTWTYRSLVAPVSPSRRGGRPSWGSPYSGRPPGLRRAPPASRSPGTSAGRAGPRVPGRCAVLEPDLAGPAVPPRLRPARVPHVRAGARADGSGAPSPRFVVVRLRLS